MFLLHGSQARSICIENAVWVGRPAVGLRVEVMMIKEAENVCHQRSDAAKAARADDFAGNLAKEALDQVEPGRGGWGQVQMEAGMTLEPGDDLGMFVSGVVVADDMNIQLGGDLALDLAQEGQPLLMAMTSGGMSKDLAREIVEGGKQGDRSVTIVIVGLGADMTLVQGETGLTALEGLTLTLLIATEHQRTIGRMEIEANHIPELLFKGQILGKFEAFESMRSDRVSRPQTLHARFAQAGFPRHRAHAPGSSARSLSSSQAQGRADGRSRYCRLAPSPGSVFKPFQALGRPTLPPATNGQEADALLSRYLLMAESLGQAQDDPGPEDIPLKACLGCHDALEFALLFRTDLNRNGGRHNPYDAKTLSLRNHIYGTLH